MAKKSTADLREELKSVKAAIDASDFEISLERVTQDLRNRELYERQKEHGAEPKQDETNLSDMLYKIQTWLRVEEELSVDKQKIRAGSERIYERLKEDYENVIKLCK